LRLIVVGSGIVGASCAYAASSLGAEVVLVDAGLTMGPLAGSLAAQAALGLSPAIDLEPFTTKG
jgi:glycine/D-amino acid oxidase-like deaminating enzyme